MNAFAHKSRILELNTMTAEAIPKRDTLLVAGGLRGIHFYLGCLCVCDCDARDYQFPRGHRAESHPGAEDRLCNCRKGKEEAAVVPRS
jgi:hypothetical protein